MKFCSKCGFQNTDSAIYCARCASSLSGGQGAGGSPTVVVVGNSGQAQPVGSNPGTVWLWLNIIAFVLTCCTTNVFGIIGIIFGAMSISKFNNGLYAEAKSNANVSKWMFIIGVVLVVIGFGVSLLFGGFTFLVSLLPFLATLGSGGY